MMAADSDRVADDAQVDSVLTAWGRQRRSSAAPPPVPTDRFVSGHGRRVAAISATAATVVVVAAALVALHATGTDSNPRPSRPGPINGLTTPATDTAGGLRTYTYHGLTVAVPASWPLNALECGTPIRDTLAIGDGLTPACLIGRPSGVTAVELSFPRPASSTTSGPISGRSIRIDGVPASRVDRLSHGLYEITVVIPSIYAQITISSPSKSRVQSIAASLRITNSDGNGCKTRSDIVELARPKKAGRAPLIPDDAAAQRAVICNYSYGYLEGSDALSGKRLASLIADVNALPAGLSEASHATYARSTCRTPSSRPGDEAALDSQVFVLYVVYEKRTVSLVARLGFCGLLGITNGATTGQRTQQLIKHLVAAPGGPQAFPGNVHAVP